MILRFPDLRALELAIGAGAIAADALARPARLAELADGSLLIEAELRLSKEEAALLSTWGVTRRRSGAGLVPIRSWLEAVPLRARAPEWGERTPIWFVLSSADQVAPMVRELLRQGNDRQSLRAVASARGELWLLQVIGPPYYTMLRALDAHDSEGSGATAPEAYYEASAGVWVRAGYEHPFASAIAPAPGEAWLLGPPRDWLAIESGPFRDLYQQLDIQLPAAPQFDSTALTPPRLAVPLRLERGGDGEPASLWILERDAEGQLDRLLANATEEIVQQWTFAVGTAPPGESAPWIALRARAGKQAAPILVLDGLALRPWHGLANLYVPLGRGLAPPLRREALQRTLAADPEELVWLRPSGEDSQDGRRGEFVPHRLREEAFRPLGEWIDYVADRDAVALDAWRGSMRFEFEEFLCAESPRLERPARDRDGPEREARGGPVSESREQVVAPPKEAILKPARAPRVARKRGAAAVSPETPTPPQVEAWTARLRALEQEFLEDSRTLDAPEREPQWEELAELHLALERPRDAALCELQRVWNDVEAGVPRWVAAERAAALAVGAGPVATELAESVEPGPIWRRLAGDEQTDRGLLSLAVAEAVERDRADSSWLAPRQDDLRALLELRESRLPLRVAWLGWTAVAERSGDLLALARTRDRLLSRMHEHGVLLVPETPAFLLSAAADAADRFRRRVPRVLALFEAVLAWSERGRGQAAAATGAYLRLVAAYGCAALGEGERGEDWLNEGLRALRATESPLHRWLAEAYEYRVLRARQRQPLAAPLPEHLLDGINSLGRDERYLIEMFRKGSTILEPLLVVDPFKHYTEASRAEGPLRRELRELTTVADGRELRERIGTLLRESQGSPDRPLVLDAALQIAPRFGQDSARSVLAAAAAEAGHVADPAEQAMLLERMLEVAAHFDQRETMARVLQRLEQLIVEQRKDGWAVLPKLASMLSKAVHGLRKLGMQDELARLLAALARTLEGATSGNDPKAADQLVLLLQVAAGWMFLGRDDGRESLTRAKELLISGALPAAGHDGTMKQTAVAAAYVEALRESPGDEPLEAWAELFSRLPALPDETLVAKRLCSLKHLRLMESLVRSVAGDVAGDVRATRWLDEEEFLIRRRIHRDLRRAMGDGGGADR